MVHVVAIAAGEAEVAKSQYIDQSEYFWIHLVCNVQFCRYTISAHVCHVVHVIVFAASEAEVVE